MFDRLSSGDYSSGVNIIHQLAHTHSIGPPLTKHTHTIGTWRNNDTRPVQKRYMASGASELDCYQYNRRTRDPMHCHRSIETRPPYNKIEHSSQRFITAAPWSCHCILDRVEHHIGLWIDRQCTERPSTDTMCNHCRRDSSDHEPAASSIDTGES